VIEPVLSVDVGGTRMRAAVVAPDGAVLRRRVEPTPRQAACPDALLALIAGLLEPTAVAEAVVGVPGRVNYATGHLEHAPNLPPGWAPALSEERLSSVLGVPVALANDADLAAVGEARFGAGRHYRDVVYLTLSTGVGAGVVLDGHLVHGRRSLTEVGHTVIDWEAAATGQPATLEDLASGTALARLAATAGLDGDGPTVVRLVQTGHPGARAVWDRVVQAAAIGVANLAHLYSPDVVVLGGGLGRVGSLLLDPIRAHLARHGPRRLTVDVVRAALGDDAGLAGAAGWREAFAREIVLTDERLPPAALRSQQLG
jgi:glucokinase